MYENIINDLKCLYKLFFGGLKVYLIWKKELI